MNKLIETSIVIDEAPTQVWSVLTDFTTYSEWNPFIQQISGELKLGAALVVEMQLPKQSPMHFEPTVITYEPGRCFAWLGKLWRPGIFDGQHEFVLESIGPNQTRLVHREYFKGWLVRPLMWFIEAPTKAAFEAMNKALKDRVESSVNDSPS